MRVTRIKKTVIGLDNKTTIYEVQFFDWWNLCRRTYIGEYSPFKTEADAKRFIDLLLAVGRSIKIQETKKERENRKKITYIKYP